MSRKIERISNYKPRHRDILPFEIFNSQKDEYHQLGLQANYTGNPVHKKTPGDFALYPPSNPRPDKTLCDKVNIFRRIEARRLLKEAFNRGLVSQAKAQNSETWPKYVWAITDEGHLVEGAYDGQGYHGYPLPDDRTPLYEKIVKRW
jgi:hypothetical protein